MPALSFVPGLLGWNGNTPNVADTSSKTSCAIAADLLRTLGVTARVSHTGQTAGRLLEEAVHDHLRSALPFALNGRSVGVSRRTVISDFEQYEHLAALKHLIDQDATGTLRATIGTDYQVKPDVTVGLASGVGSPFLHAAVPCKWTLRSDRAQNVRHEAVILIRHRRGRLPHITPVTAEPMPTRLASLARGTAEVDALYHVALDELTAAVRASGAREQIDVLEELVGHRRLFDLSDLAAVLQTS
ncbi:MAG: restriction endonuclease [Actinomycetota bacterium]|nr:restriction endonuclease [Actinomycetota bacterium]